MSKNNRDIEHEMSKFEEEINRITPSSSSTSSVAGTESKPKAPNRINIQIHSTIPKLPNPYAGNGHPTPPPPPPPPLQMPPPPPMAAYMANLYGNNSMNSASNAASQQYIIPSNLKPHSIQTPSASVPSSAHKNPPPSTSANGSGGGAQKREASSSGGGGNPSQAKMPKIMPTTAAAAAQSVAAAAVVEKKSTNKKEPWDKNKKKSKFIRAAAGETWEDESLLEWDPDDFRLFCGDLGNEVNDESLARAFQKYGSFQKAKVVRDKRTGKTKGYGFVSFKSSEDFIKAMREMDGKYVGNRPIKLRKSNWKDRNLDAVRRKESEKQKMGLK